MIAAVSTGVLRERGVALMDSVNLRNLLGLLDWLDVQINHNCFVVAAHKDKIERLILARINFLVRHERRHIDKIAGPASAVNSSRSPQRMRALPCTT